MTRRARSLFAAAVLALAGGAVAQPHEWDVSESLGFPRLAEFETDEGTWMSLDVSPDGRTIVFDLLGDIYRLSIEGGDAERLSGGPSFEHMPRYSPDGSFIAFVSDRSGADNLWVMESGGGSQKPVTREQELLPTSPFWTPDGEYLAAKRHMVDVRSIGGGEIWLYHRRGGSGFPIVPRESYTSDINEPTISPDGRWLYYSHSGPFAYDRNPHQGIFQISRLDLRSGGMEPVTTPPRSSSRPLPSPDGKRLAFVRRIGLETVLMLRDLSTGSERALFENLDHDQMETWTLHGTYPAFAWTPDSRSLLIHASGKIHRIDAETGASTIVPFRAKVSIPLASRMTFSADPGTGPTFGAKVLRWPLLTSGNEWIFQAAGRLWRANASGGTPERITRSGPLEFSPSLSPDESQLAFSTWDAREGGALWKIDNRPGAVPTRLSREAELYVNPAWSPDGTRIAFVRGTGETNRGREPADEPFFRVAWIPADGGEFHEVGTTENRGSYRRMPAVSWSADGTRIHLLETVGGRSAPYAREGKTVLSSFALDGGDRRELVRNDMAEEIVLSPDGRFVAFQESHQVYAAPLPPVSTAEPMLVTANESPTPVARLSRFGGSGIRFTSDGKNVTWALGPTLVRQRLEDAFPEGASANTAASDSNLAVPGEAVEVRLDVRRPIPEGQLALVGARIVTLRGEEVLESGTLVVEGNRIVSVTAGRDRVPEAARVVDVSGRTIIPGLVDVHAHINDGLDVNPQSSRAHLATLAYGFTTAHDPYAPAELVFSNGELIEAGESLGPRLFSTGPGLYAAHVPHRANIDSLEEARGHVKRLKAMGASAVKSYLRYRRKEQQWIVAAAREEKVNVYVEGGLNFQMNVTHLIDGHAGIEHMMPLAELRSDVLRLVAESQVAITPTLVVSFGGLAGEDYWYQTSDVFQDDRLKRFTSQEWLDARARRRLLAAVDDHYYLEQARTMKRILDAGGRIHVGGHGQIHGIGPHWEMWMLAQGGMTPYEVLRSATLWGASYLGMGEHLGSLEPGKLADLVVLEANPLEDIQNSQKVEMVMKNGFLYDASLEPLWPLP